MKFQPGFIKAVKRMVAVLIFVAGLTSIVFLARDYAAMHERVGILESSAVTVIEVIPTPTASPSATPTPTLKIYRPVNASQSAR